MVPSSFYTWVVNLSMTDNYVEGNVNPKKELLHMKTIEQLLLSYKPIKAHNYHHKIRGLDMRHDTFYYIPLWHGKPYSLASLQISTPCFPMN